MKLGDGRMSLEPFAGEVRITLSRPGAQVYVDASADEAGHLAAELATVAREALTEARKEARRITRPPSSETPPQTK